ncbi:hypothetical protein GCM10009748_17070 [Agromyces lapidis]
MPNGMRRLSAAEVEPHKIVSAGIACAFVALLVGCTQTGAGAPASTAPPSPAVTEDAEACDQLTTPLSLIFNVQAAPEGAIDAETAGGLYFTAAWDLNRIDESLEDSGLDAPVTRLKEAANAMNVHLGRSDDPATWSDQLDKIGAAQDEINAICGAVDAEWGIIGWYGG